MAPTLGSTGAEIPGFGSLLVGMDGRTWLLLALRVLVLASVIAGVPDLPSPVAHRFHELANTSGVPYRDFAVEYPIGEIGLIEIVGLSTPEIARIVLGSLAFAADLLAFGSLLFGWGREVASRYLVLGAPLLIFMYRRIDLVVVATTALALALSQRERVRPAGAWLSVGTLVKLWPAVLAPIMIMRRQIRGLRAFVIVTVVGLLGWIAVAGGFGGIRQVVSFRGANGWEVESVVGAVVWAATGEHRFEQGANRTGVVPGWARAISVALLAGALAGVWWRARRTRLDLAGAPSLAAVASLLTLSPLLSPHFVSWLLPMSAIAASEERRWSWLAAIPLWITAGIVGSWYLQLQLGPGWTQALLIARNVALIAIPLAWLFGREQRAELDRRDPGLHAEPVP
jgi:glycosyl transferase family 87